MKDWYNKHKELVLIGAFILAVIIFGSLAQATEPHGHKTTQITVNNDYTRGIALGLAASAHQFDLNTHGLQWSVGAGSYDGAEALSGGLGMRFGKILVNGSIGTEDGHTGTSIGISGKF